MNRKPVRSSGKLYAFASRKRGLKCSFAFSPKQAMNAKIGLLQQARVYGVYNILVLVYGAVHFVAIIAYQDRVFCRIHQFDKSILRGRVGIGPGRRDPIADRDHVGKKVRISCQMNAYGNTANDGLVRHVSPPAPPRHACRDTLPVDTGWSCSYRAVDRALQDAARSERRQPTSSRRGSESRSLGVHGVLLSLHFRCGDARAPPRAHRSAYPSGQGLSRGRAARES